MSTKKTDIERAKKSENGEMRFKPITLLKVLIVLPQTPLHDDDGDDDVNDDGNDDDHSDDYDDDNCLFYRTL